MAPTKKKTTPAKKTAEKTMATPAVKSVAKPVAPKKTSNKKVWIISGIVVILLVAGGLTAKFCCKGKDGAMMSISGKSPVIAVVDGEDIRLSELQKVKDGIPQLKDIPMEAVYSQLLDAYVTNRIVLDQAKKAGLQNDEDVKKAMKDAEDQILFQAYLAREVKARMTPQKLQEIYEVEVQNFVPQDEIHARHILVATQKEANDIIVQLKAGANFAALADKYSMDAAGNGGDLGYFTKNMMIPEFGDVAFSIPVGKFSTTPIKTPFGYHVVKVEDKRKSSPPTFAMVEEGIKAKFAEATAAQVIQDERTKANVKINNIFEDKAKTTETAK